MRQVTFEMRLFDDDSTDGKLRLCSPLDAMWDDERNEIPDLYYQLVNAPKGAALRITVERLDVLPISEAI